MYAEGVSSWPGIDNSLAEEVFVQLKPVKLLGVSPEAGR